MRCLPLFLVACELGNQSAQLPRVDRTDADTGLDETGGDQGGCPYKNAYEAVTTVLDGGVLISSDGDRCIVEVSLVGLPQSEDISPGCAIIETLTLELFLTEMWHGEASAATYCDGTAVEGTRPYAVTSVLFEPSGSNLIVTPSGGNWLLWEQPIRLRVTP